MKHASSDTLNRIEPLLREIRRFEPLVERKHGIWYLRSRAFLHFHEDPAGIFADVKVGSVFERLPANTARERAALLRRVRGLVTD